MPTVAITHHNRIGTAIEEALTHMRLGELCRAKRIAVKPNET